MKSSGLESKEYTVSVRTNNIQKAIALTGSALYDLLGQALMTADDEDEEDESDFARFALETRNVLGSYPEQLSDDDDEPELDGDAFAAGVD